MVFQLGVHSLVSATSVKLVADVWSSIQFTCSIFDNILNVIWEYRYMYNETVAFTYDS